MARAVAVHGPCLPEGYSEVRVTVNSDGSVNSVKVIHSCGASGCDNLSLNEAQHSIYRPKTVNCKPVEGTYEYIRVFVIG
jgi:outer membrane biosynthesis protein TonB